MDATCITSACGYQDVIKDAVFEITKSAYLEISCVSFFFFSIQDKILENRTLSLSSLCFWVHNRVQGVYIGFNSSYYALASTEPASKISVYLMIKKYMACSIVGTESQTRKKALKEMILRPDGSGLVCTISRRVKDRRKPCSEVFSVTS